MLVVACDPMMCPKWSFRLGFNDCPDVFAKSVLPLACRLLTGTKFSTESRMLCRVLFAQFGETLFVEYVTVVWRVAHCIAHPLGILQIFLHACGVLRDVPQSAPSESVHSVLTPDTVCSTPRFFSLFLGLRACRPTSRPRLSASSTTTSTVASRVSSMIHEVGHSKREGPSIIIYYL